jgi:hypothetical protein
MKIDFSSAVLLSALAVTTPLFFKQTVENTTTFKATVSIEYAACRSERFVLEAGKSQTVDGQACLVKRVSATVSQMEAGKATATDVIATPYSSSGLSGNRTWTITSSAPGKYEVVRKP